MLSESKWALQCMEMALEVGMEGGKARPELRSNLTLTHAATQHKDWDLTVQILLLGPQVLA